MKLLQMEFDYFAFVSTRVNSAKHIRIFFPFVHFERKMRLHSRLVHVHACTYELMDYPMWLRVICT
jgi:hypothetical protein